MCAGLGNGSSYFPGIPLNLKLIVYKSYVNSNDSAFGLGVALERE